MKEKGLSFKREEWAKFPDYMYKAKEFDQYKVELIAGTGRGGWIVVWQKVDTWPEVKSWDTVEDGWVLVTEAPFWYYKNALACFNVINNREGVQTLVEEVLA